MESDHKMSIEGDPLEEVPVAEEEINQKEEEEKGYEKKHITDNFLCIVGLQHFMIEKDVIKLLKKGLGSLPIKGVQKKRGQNFGFLQFADHE
jgi:hypothetical protein